MLRILLIVPLLAVLPMTAGCLTTLVVTSVAGSGAGGEHVEAAKETARDVADSARDKMDDMSLSVHDALESLTSN